MMALDPRHSGEKFKLTRRNMKIWQQAGLVAGVFGIGAAVAGAQSYDGSAAGAGPYFHLGSGSPLFENDRLSDPRGQVAGTTEYRQGSAMDAAVGWNFNPNEAAELELGFAGANSNGLPGYFSDNASVANAPLLANFTLSVPLSCTAMVPYFGAGAGGDDVLIVPNGFSPSPSTVLGNENDVVFAWQAFTGLRFKMSPRASLGLGYKYFATGDPNYPSSVNLPAALAGVRDHSVLLTFQWKF